jgi:hypothetical protein
VQVLEKVTGEKWAIEKTTTEEQIAVSREALANGDILGAYYHYCRNLVGQGIYAFQGRET